MRSSPSSALRSPASPRCRRASASSAPTTRSTASWSISRARPAAPATIEQNDRLVAVVRVDSDEAAGRVLLVDRLAVRPRDREPAAGRQRRRQEPRLAQDDTAPRAHRVPRRSLRGGIQSLRQVERQRRPPPKPRGRARPDDQKKSGAPRRQRHGRLHRPRRDTGTFVHPAATVEDMYRPERHARTASGKLTVTAKE